jgi:ABC-type dipeptide/oligopeptide/nickel transport system permease component
MKRGRAAGMLLTLLAGGLLTFWLVRTAPGYDTDDSELDGRRSAGSVATLRAQNRTQAPLLRSYVEYVGGLVRGDFGKSRAWDLPVSQLLKERGMVTLRSAGTGMIVGGLAAVLLAIAGSCRSSRWLTGAGKWTSSGFLCLPPPGLALLLCIAMRQTGPEFRAAAAVATLVFARVFLTSAALVKSAYNEPFVLQARARGVFGLRLIGSHVLRRAAAPLAALMAAAAPFAFGVAVPVEVVCNLPGAGQLAWLAAQKRDLPVLAGLTMVLLLIMLICESAAGMTAPAFSGRGQKDSAR